MRTQVEPGISPIGLQVGLGFDVLVICSVNVTGGGNGSYSGNSVQQPVECLWSWNIVICSDFSTWTILVSPEGNTKTRASPCCAIIESHTIFMDFNCVQCQKSVQFLKSKLESRARSKALLLHAKKVLGSLPSCWVWACISGKCDISRAEENCGWTTEIYVERTTKRRGQIGKVPWDEDNLGQNSRVKWSQSQADSKRLWYGQWVGFLLNWL